MLFGDKICIVEKILIIKVLFWFLIYMCIYSKCIVGML